MWRWVLVVLALHAGLWVAMLGVSVWQVEGSRALRVGPMHTRWVSPEPMNQQAAPTPMPARAPGPRVATVPQPAAIRQAALPPAAPPEPLAEPAPATQTATADHSASEAGQPEDTKPPESTSLAQAPPVAAPSAEAPSAGGMTEASMALPPLGVGSLPPSVMLSYRLHGQERNIPYQATGELRWQHNAGAYAMSLSVRAFLLGSRHWRSQGQITAQGLAPVRFSDSWRSERATHFDRAQNRIVFSSNAPVASLQPGAQDQISLYAQLAALMAQEGARLSPGTRVQVQTATVRDALPWLLTLEQEELLQVDGAPLMATKWVGMPRNRFDAKVEFWVAAAHDWLPVRIRITQVSGNFIDLLLTAREALPELPASPVPS
ncbi:MAG: DUF3108 domain-containing protein [Betaproteobacteria bacterium]|nr:DUF3108 domain-containing protein [Betaproteobacteria bacterium]